MHEVGPFSISHAQRQLEETETFVLLDVANKNVGLVSVSSA